MKTEIEKQECEHQKSSAEVTLNHSKELKDLGKWRTGSQSAKARGQKLSVSTRINQSVCLSINQSYTELSCSQKLMVEHERYQDLQRKYERMQEDYEMQLKAAEESRVQGLKEQTQLYEARLQEKTHLLAQVGREEPTMTYKGQGHRMKLVSSHINFHLCSVRRMHSSRSVILKRS